MKRNTTSERFWKKQLGAVLIVTVNDPSSLSNIDPDPKLLECLPLTFVGEVVKATKSCVVMRSSWYPKGGGGTDFHTFPPSSVTSVIKCM